MRIYSRADNHGFGLRAKRHGRISLHRLLIAEGRKWHVGVAQLFAQLGRGTRDTRQVDVTSPIEIG